MSLTLIGLFSIKNEKGTYAIACKYGEGEKDKKQSKPRLTLAFSLRWARACLNNVRKENLQRKTIIVNRLRSSTLEMPVMKYWGGVEGRLSQLYGRIILVPASVEIHKYGLNKNFTWNKQTYLFTYFHDSHSFYYFIPTDKIESKADLIS